MIPNSLITAASFAPNSLQSPNAWVGHLPFAAWVIQEIKPKIFVELGTHSGNSYFSFCQSVIEAGLSTKCYAVDTWQGDEHAGQYDEEIFAKVNVHHQEHYAKFSRLLRMPFDDAVTYFADESIGLLHIDGLHTYKAVRHDFETWLPKLAPGAVVIFHDTNVRERNFGVWKLWKELQARYPNNLEFVHAYGLGVLQLNNTPNYKKLKWLQPNSNEKQELKNYFAALGSRQLEHYELNELKQHTVNLNQIVAERDGQIVSLNQAVQALTATVAQRDVAVSERDGRLQEAYQRLSERDARITNLNQTVNEREGQIAGLNQAVAEYDQAVQALIQQVVERDAALAERDTRIVNLNQVVAERDGQIVSLVAERDQIFNSTSWEITKPLRAIRRTVVNKPYRLLRKILSDVARQVWIKLPLSNQHKLLFKHKLFINLPFVFRWSQAYRSWAAINAPSDTTPNLIINRGVSLTAERLSDVYVPLFQVYHKGRIFLPDIDSAHDFKVDRETILVVSHEASRTGAPVLSLNIVQAFVGRYNVVALLLDGGPLSNAFCVAGTAVMTVSNIRGNPALAHRIISQLCERFNFKFAVVNSIESRIVLPSLSHRFVPTISLLHEFASYTRPRDAFRDAFFWSGEVVFSANVTLENALAEYPDMGDRSAYILPQGRCLLPLGEFSEEQLQAERSRISGLIRPNDIAENSVVVIGAGFVHLRKGVDLFIECAARVVRAPEGNRWRFVWIGKGYDPENDVGYSVYLADQIRRAGLQGHVFFIDETPAIETAYEEADLFLLSSRLDPLPNVAIDAMAHGVPVLCFNKTTGIADFLIDSGLGNHCVAEYLDSADMSKKILALAGSQVLRESIADRCREIAIDYFSMEKYIARLDALARNACDRTQQEKADIQVILGSGLLRRDFSCLPHQHDQSNEEVVRVYVRAWASGIGRRKPFPGFHPGIYLEQHGIATQGADPFADYLRVGRPDGSWNYPVIVASEINEKVLPGNQRVALHLHVYYPALIQGITTRLSHNRICPDLFVSVTDKETRNFVVEHLKNYKGKVVDIQLVPNRGRDIGPLFTAFSQGILANYDYIGHLHTKKSVAVADETVGKSWYKFLLENLLGGESGNMADSILAKMKNDTSIGMVFPDDPNIVGWGANRAIAESLAVRIGIQKLSEHFVFPVGTMFWARTSALAPWINLKLDWSDYSEEPLPYDGTSLHAIERLLSLSLSSGNLRCAATNVVGVTR